MTEIYSPERFMPDIMCDESDFDANNTDNTNHLLNVSDNRSE